MCLFFSFSKLLVFCELISAIYEGFAFNLFHVMFAGLGALFGNVCEFLKTWALSPWRSRLCVSFMDHVVCNLFRFFPFNLAFLSYFLLLCSFPFCKFTGVSCLLVLYIVYCIWCWSCNCSSCLFVCFLCDVLFSVLFFSLSLIVTLYFGSFIIISLLCLLFSYIFRSF